MKKVILSALCLIGLISMSFTKSNSNKDVIVKTTTTLDFEKDFNRINLSKLKGVKKSDTSGSSATAFPGTLTDTFTVFSEEITESNVKMNNVINKY